MNNPFHHKRIYSVAESIKNEANFDDRKAKVGSDIIIPLPKFTKPPRPKLTAGIANFIISSVMVFKP